MPRPMLRTPQNQTQSQTVNNNILSATRNQEHEQQQQQMDKMKLDQLLRKKRSKEYMEALHKLDAGGHVHNQNKVNDIIRTIQEEFPEVQLGGVLLGYVSICISESLMKCIHWILQVASLNIIKQEKHFQMASKRHVPLPCVADMSLLKFIKTAAGRSVPADMFL